MMILELAFGHCAHAAFLTHIAVFLGLISLAVGYGVFLKAKTDTCCPRWGKFLGIFISVVSLLGLICTFYLSLKRCYYAQESYEYHKILKDIPTSEGK